MLDDCPRLTVAALPPPLQIAQPVRVACLSATFDQHGPRGNHLEATSFPTTALNRTSLVVDDQSIKMRGATGT